MREHFSWRKFCEQKLKFSYPTTYENISTSVFLKKFASDYFFAHLFVILLLIVALRPYSSIGNLISAAKIFVFNIVFWLWIEAMRFGIFNRKSKEPSSSNESGLAPNKSANHWKYIFWLATATLPLIIAISIIIFDLRFPKEGLLPEFFFTVLLPCTAPIYFYLKWQKAKSK